MLRSVAEKSPQAHLFEDAFDDYHAGDLETALSKYFYLADLGFEVAQFNAAHILIQAGSVAGYRRALVYLHRSANQGNVESRLKLGDLFYEGKGIPAPDMITAYMAYKDAYGKNNPQASFNLGYMYERGLGVPQDFFLARRYYDAAAVMDKKHYAEAWFPVQLAVIGLGIREARGRIKELMKTALPYVATVVLMFAGLFVALRRFVPRPVPRQ